VLRGIYIAASGMLAESARQDVVAENLANATTTGFKRSEAVASPFQQMLVRNAAAAGAPEVGTLTMGTQVEGIARIDAQGPLRYTGNALDVGLSGSGYFAVDTPDGRRYTRAGAFDLDATGRLVTKEGQPVLGDDGRPITLDPGSVSIAADGTITQDGAVKGRLMLTMLDPATVKTQGDSLLTGTVAGTASAQVRQSTLEGSTVNVVSEMVELIRVMRSFEANQKSVQSQDEALQASVTRVGSVG
jgi:flagellar basal-body rod protein FlgF